MDTLHFEWRDFDGTRGDRPVADHAVRITDVNLSEVEIFMLRGRRLQAQAIGGLWRRAVGRLGRMLGGTHGHALPPGRHRRV
jgi:hypothetical protein